MMSESSKSHSKFLSLILFLNVLCFYVFGHRLCWSEKIFYLEDVVILQSAGMKICILSTFPAYGKVGVNQKIFG